MGYQVLARKYRPQRFSDVAGQDHVTRTLTNALTQGRIAHGYIFSGHRGIGKTTIARILAMALNCRNTVGSPERPTVEPCLKCLPCREISSGGNASGEEALSHSFDFIEIDAASNRGIDDVRSIIQQAEVRPARDRYKIFLLDEAHQITDAAFNAILKTLEEPPDWVIFMMATTEPENIPQTIRSRCQHFSFHAVKFDDILGQLRAIAEHENVATDETALSLLAEAGDGSMRDALSIMDQAIASAPLENGRPLLNGEQIRELMGSVPNAVFERLMESVSAQDTAKLMEDLDKLLSVGNSPSALARQLVRYLRNCLMAKLGGENTQLLAIAQDERSRAARTAQLFTEDDLTRNLQIALRTFDDLNFRQEQRFHLELGLLKLIQAQKLLPVEEILSGMASSASRRPSTPGGPAPARTSPDSSSIRPAAPVQPRPATPSSPTISPFGNPRSALSSTSGPTLGPIPVPDLPRHAPEPVSGPTTATTAGALALEIPEQPAIAQDLAASAQEPPTAQAQIAESVPDDSPLPSPVLPLETSSSSPANETAVEISTSAEIPEEAGSFSPLNEAPLNERALAPAKFPPLSAAPQPAAAPDNLDAIITAVAQALASGGHGTAATLVEGGKWAIEGGVVRIEVDCKAKMIKLTFNAVAEKLIRQGLTESGAPTRFMILPGEGLATPGAARVRAPLGSIEQEARNNPLVLEAMSVFNAEIVSVIDLRKD
ncbi:DNA polymerase III subunit gamma/tau [Acidicapsa dinghuensis]|uniref:DNA polymerase III subunit gamma/tau n=1 Tax=Acidicapsa dinghuensis TaxID=2218256 RepID=A0ABW1EQA2_9BACT|nr:DNA polymerase III subunit gamma/tau [Acidicapsa dinghuensis]